jgi:hypothetical protein
MHDLVRLYARRLSIEHADADGREAARARMLAFYLGYAAASEDHLRALPGTTVPGTFTSRDDTLAWLDTELPGLIAAVTMAENTGNDQAVMMLPLFLAEYLHWRRRLDDWLTVTTASLNAARRLGDRPLSGDQARSGLERRPCH